MDETIEFIEMSRKAYELQKLFITDPTYAKLHGGYFISWTYRTDHKAKEHVVVLGKFFELDRERGCLFIPGEGRGSHLASNYHAQNDVDWVWVPRLDNLFDLLPGGYMSRAILMHFFAFGRDEYEGLYTKPPSEIFKSIEQIVIGLVMYENYKKVWDGTDWIEFTDQIVMERNK